MHSITLRELHDKLKRDGIFTDDDQVPIKALLSLFTPLSRNTMINHNSNWDRSKQYEEYARESTKQLIQCIELEMHELGQSIRKNLKCPELTWETDLYITD